MPRRKTGARKATNVSIDAALLKEARAYGINLSRAAESGVAEATASAKVKRWREENSRAIDSSNAYVEEHGLPLDKYRQF